MRFILFVTLLCNRSKSVINSKIYWRNIALLIMPRLIKSLKLTWIFSKTQTIGVMMPHPNFTESNVSTSDLWCEPFPLNPNNFTRYTKPNGAQQITKDIDIISSCTSRCNSKKGLSFVVLPFDDLRFWKQKRESVF